MPAATAQVDWTAYAQRYDLMASHNPAYQAILAQLHTVSRTWPLSSGDVVVDLGAGTGNFSYLLAEQLRMCRVLHIDVDRGMNQAARQKTMVKGLT